MIATIDKISVEIAQMVIASGIPGLTGSTARKGLTDDSYTSRLIKEAAHNFYGSNQSFSWTQAWNVSCELRISWDDETKVRGGKNVECAVPNCYVSWSITTRDISESRACILLYTAVTDLATLIQTHFSDRHIESKDDAYSRIHKDKIAQTDANRRQKQDLIPDGAVFEILKGGGAKPYLDHLVFNENRPPDCGGQLKVDPEACCEAPAKSIIWNKEHNKFLGRCGRHTKQIHLTPND